MLFVLLLLAAGTPAAILRAGCAGPTCDEAVTQTPQVPFCSLPTDLRDLIVAGFFEDRSPDVIAVASAGGVAGATRFGDGSTVPWISTTGTDSARIPIVLSGPGLEPGAKLPDGTGLDDLAPSVAPVLGLQTAPARKGDPPLELSVPRPALVLLVAWKGIGSRDLESAPDTWPFLQGLLDGGNGTLEGSTASLPVDPAATITTFGTGTTPSGHGIVGGLLRSPYDRRLERAGGREGPPRAVPTLAEALDRANRERSLVGLVGTAPADDGLIGGRHFVRADEDEIIVMLGASPAAVAERSQRLLEGGFGKDEVPDVIGVVMEGSPAELDEATRHLADAAARLSGRSSLLVVVGTGATGRGSFGANELLAAVRAGDPDVGAAVGALAPAGVFLGADAATLGIAGQDVADALLGVRDEQGRQVIADAFPRFALSLASYCR